MGDISTAFVKQFGSTIELLVQQQGSKLRGAVRMESGVQGEQAFFDQLAPTTAVLRTTRNADTPLIKSDNRRRSVVLLDYEWADLVDDQDKLKMIVDPNNPYARNAAFALGRSIDDNIITAFNATALTDKTGSTSTPLPAGQIIVNGGTALTIDKLRQAKQIMDTDDVPAEGRYIVISPIQLTNLLETTEVTSSDFATVKALVMGDLNTFLGFSFIMSTRLPISGNIRSAFAWHREGMLLATAKEITTRITERDDKSYATQIYLSMGIGATRMQEDLVVQVDTDETA
jgi:hypothetical protein